VRSREGYHRAVGFGEFGEKFSLPDEAVTRADDGFLVHRGGDHGIEFTAQTQFTRPT